MCCWLNMGTRQTVLTQAVLVQYAAIFDMESWLYLDGLHGIETVAIIFGSRSPGLQTCQ